MSEFEHREGAPPPVPAERVKRVPLTQLPGRQRQVLDTIVRFYLATEEACTSTFIARRLSIHHSTVQKHISVLHRKGWLRGPNPPAIPTRW